MYTRNMISRFYHKNSNSDDLLWFDFENGIIKGFTVEVGKPLAGKLVIPNIIGREEVKMKRS